MSEIGKKIKKIRKEKNLTLSDVAQDQLSPAMISLIENGKSKPSAEKLKHIAQALNVEISDLLGGITREELREEITRIKKIMSKTNSETLEKAMSKIKELLPNLGHNVESAKIYEMYARYLSVYYQLYKSKYDELEDKDWVVYLKKAEEIFADLQMESNVFTIHLLLALSEYYKGNYPLTIEMIDESLQSVKSLDSYDTISDIITLKTLKVYCLEAIGDSDASLQTLNEVIEFSQKHLMLNQMFEIYNIGAMIHYNGNDYETARHYIDKINKFFALINNDHLYIDKELIFIHYMEFYENLPEKSLEMIDHFESKVKTMSLHNDLLVKILSEHLSDFKARCFTKLHQPEKAIPLFKNLMADSNAKVHPHDIATRVVNKSYQALCYMQLNKKEKALEYAKESVKILKKYPQTAYYQYARNVLQDIQLSFSKK
ncbi:helix-turn-helix domain-containing protein [Ornithinibacillus sp. L9]|uniref:Helix-turn-helix domain-containing protein n=1 Tax=Ornithinibacillus caprae TaxID=2678566 RepID=A0A6N8FNH2_9BACI|nr:helix-turn-helix transcriptional regulator [Ornithinibacillus caprae]MUK90781.1 helix-turn-helix domain-containing protein [Ornithinibacillus caprae]